MSETSPFYIALGDSMTIDLYPNTDARTRWGLCDRALGAASLLYANDPLWPEFEAKDLRTRYPGLGLKNFAMDGATVRTVLESQLPEAQSLNVAIATLTVGGNDLLRILWSGRPLDAAVAELGSQLEDLYGRIREAFPKARLLLNTIYDPTDGTGHLPEYPGRLPIEFLEQSNVLIRNAARGINGAILSDVHAHFWGHGLSATEEELWYLRSHMIEPGARGAHEIRRLWWEALEAA